MAVQPFGVPASPPGFAEGAFYPFIQVTNEFVEQDWIHYLPLVITRSQASDRLCTTDYNSLSSLSQPVHNSPHCPLIYPTLPKLTYKDVTQTVSKALLKSKYKTSIAVPSSTQLVKTSQKITRLVKGSLLLVNPH